MKSKAWKMSASVVIAVRSVLQGSNTKTLECDGLRHKRISEVQRANLQILSLRRGESAKVLPGTHVFPGGNIDSSDCSPEWLKLFKASGYDENSFTTNSLGGSLNGGSKSRESNCLPGWMSLRLCAIRETFEESGILLCRSTFESSQDFPWASCVSLKDLEAWQCRVRADPYQMIALCESEECVPDVWGLHIWSNWLTPVQQSIRHNAFFFLAVLCSAPQHSLDNFEMDELKWCSPIELVEGVQNARLRLPNPQLYEASRLSTFCHADVLVDFAANRASHGCDRVMPIQECTKDGMLFLLPGDGAYLKNVDYETSRSLTIREESLAELRNRVLCCGGALHRIEILSENGIPKLYVQNLIPTFNHVLPLATDTLFQIFNENKL